MLNVITIHPQSDARELTIASDDFRQFQALVGGIFTTAFYLEPNLGVYCHDEGLLLGMPPNVFHPEHNMLLVGSLFVSRFDDDGESVSTTPADLETVRAWLATCERPGRFDYGL